MARKSKKAQTPVKRLLHYAKIDEHGFGHGPACGAKFGPPGTRDWIPKGVVPPDPEEDVCLSCIYAVEKGVRVAQIRLVN